MNATQGSPGIHHLVQPTLQRDAGGLGHRRAGKLRDRRELAIVDTHQAAAIGSDHILLEPGDRSEERRVGKECVSTCRSRWSPYHKKTTSKNEELTKST